MARSDLLALTNDDLAVLTNRGTVKRAQRELDAGECTADLREEGDGTLIATWSDGVECRLPGGKVVREGRCSCLTGRLCRHLIRSVLAYQRQVAAQPTPATTTPVNEPWDPGAIDDNTLARHFKPTVLDRARRQFEQGVLVELVRSCKPSARFHQEAFMLRFLVPGDPRYTHCDCSATAPCRHVPLAIWAFRRLPVEQEAGILSTQAAAVPVPTELLEDLEAALLELATHGAAGTARVWRDHTSRLEQRCRKSELIWPAEILGELNHEIERYTSHDARFEPEQVAELAGELLIRSDALRRQTGALPPLLVRGTAGDRDCPLGISRLIGLGCGVGVSRRAVHLSAFLQETDSGTVMAIQRDFPREPSAEPRAFADLAQTVAVAGVPFAALGVGQLLMQGGKRSAGHRLVPGRSRASVQPQPFAWERLHAPVLVEEFAELRARLGALPPASLRPRRVAADFHVCPVAEAEAVQFIPATQTIQAILRDGRGQPALLEHPFSSPGRSGAEALLARLSESAADLRFVAGPVRLGARGLLIRPVCLVFQQGEARTAVQPWVERGPVSASTTLPVVPSTVRRGPLLDYLHGLLVALGDLFVLGLQRVDGPAARRWADLRDQGEALGLARLVRPVADLAEQLQRLNDSLDEGAEETEQAMLRLVVIARLAQDLAQTGPDNCCG